MSITDNRITMLNLLLAAAETAPTKHEAELIIQVTKRLRNIQMDVARTVSKTLTALN